MHFAFLAPANAQDGASLAAREEAALRAAAESVADSVVQIRTIGGLDAVGGVLLADGPTTGLVVSPDGYIVSSAFNFVQQPASILVTFASGRQAPAELVATDHSRMLVLLKAAGVADLPVATAAPVEEIGPGQWAIAVGRTFRADRVNVSVGIVSAVGRMFGRVIQTDAATSTANYGGPLVDIRGRVLGVIVPMAPHGASEVAGVEWYDSGIGFAVPLAAIAERLEQLKQGEDQRPGVLGIGMKAGNPHTSPAELSAVRPDSPAGRAGLKQGDRIVELDGRPIETQTDLRFALGTRYGGESVRVVALRGDERLERIITLAGELPAYRHAFLGILPMRATAPTAEQQDADAQADEPAEADAGEADDETPETGGDMDQTQGIVVRMVYPGSPAQQAGVRAGDRIERIDDTEIKSIDNAIQALNNLAPGYEVTLHAIRDGEPLELAITTGRLPTSVPDKLPPAQPKAAEDDAAAAEGETRELKLPEFPHECKVYVPASHESRGPLAVLLWLHAPGEADADEVIRRWRAICDRDGVLLVAPTAADTSRWERTELEYLRRLTERVLGEYNVDRHRLVVFGQEGGGAMAWLLALSGREVFSGVATSAAPLLRQVRVPPNEPALRLAVFAAISSNNDVAAQVAQGLQKLSEAGYNVATITTTASTGRLSEAELNELARWIDTLDRL